MSQPGPKSVAFTDCLGLLKALEQAGGQAVVVGGQAVNFWAQMFEDAAPELRQFRPFTSTDLDLHRPDTAAHSVLRKQAINRSVDHDPFGKVFSVVSQLFQVKGPAGTSFRVDSLKLVAGLKSEEITRGTMVVEFAGVKLRVLDPITCLKAKLHNVRQLAQANRQDEKHVRILIICVRHFLARLIAEGASYGNYRPALNALQQLVLLTSRRDAVTTGQQHAFDFVQSLPVAELSASQHPKLQAFMARQFPRWHALVGRAG